jgi:hypothetical protein
VQQQMIEQEVQCKNKQEMKYKWDTRIYDFWLPLGNNEELNNVKKKDDSSLSMGKFPSAFISKDLNKMLKETEEYIK